MRAKSDTKKASPVFKAQVPKVLKDPTSYKVPEQKPLTQEKKVKFVDHPLRDVEEKPIKNVFENNYRLVQEYEQEVNKLAALNELIKS